jgi:hypothetical protein
MISRDKGRFYEKARLPYAPGLARDLLRRTGQLARLFASGGARVYDEVEYFCHELHEGTRIDTKGTWPKMWAGIRTAIHSWPFGIIRVIRGKRIALIPTAPTDH